MGGWYTVGLFLGLGVALGVLLAGLLAAVRWGALLAAAAAAGAVAAVGAVVQDWPEGVAGAAGGIVGALGAAPVVRSALGRGGTRAGTGVLVAVGALVLAALAFVPVAGYLEAVAVPALAARLRRRAGRTYAGLRILARD
jgi:hypothetical protein